MPDQDLHAAELPPEYDSAGYERAFRLLTEPPTRIFDFIKESVIPHNQVPTSVRSNVPTRAEIVPFALADNTNQTTAGIVIFSENDDGSLQIGGKCVLIQPSRAGLRVVNGRPFSSSEYVQPIYYGWEDSDDIRQNLLPLVQYVHDGFQTHWKGHSFIIGPDEFAIGNIPLTLHQQNERFLSFRRNNGVFVPRLEVCQNRGDFFEIMRGRVES